MSSQRATLVDHDELADLQDEPPVYGDDLARNQDGQPPPILQIQDVETAIDTREQSVPPTPEANTNTPPFQQQPKGPPQPGSSPVLFINDRQTQLNVANTPVAATNGGVPRVVVTQPGGDSLVHVSPMVVQPPAPPSELRRSLKSKDILFLQVFAAIVCVCFPFTGVIAILHATSTRTFFREGKMDLALKYAQKAERFILCTIILGFLFLIVLIAIIEAAVKKDNSWHHNWSFTGANG